MRIVLTGGGTGGHAYPALSIAETIRAHHPDWEILYLGSRGGLEAGLAESAGIPFEGLTSRKLSRLISPDTLLTVAALARGFGEAIGALNRFGPDLVIGTGGYVAAAVVLAQVLRRGKTLIHEQNVIPGRTNLLLGRFASRVCVTFEDTLKHFPKEKTIVTGLPIRETLLKPPDRNSSREALELDREPFTVLVLGGSQGARRVNEAIADSVPELSKLPIQVFHQVGRRNYEESEERCRSFGWNRYHVRAYIDDMAQAYAASDLVVGRSGASTIAEVTVMGLPAVLIPYPHAYADHQRYNAESMVRNGAGVMILESELTPDTLVGDIRRLLESPADLERMGKASKALGRPDAAVKVLAAAGLGNGM